MVKRRNLIFLQPVLAAFIGATTSFAFAPYSFWPMALISPLLLLLLIADQSPKTAFGLSFCWGLGLFVHGLSWVHVSIDTFGGVPQYVSYSLVVLLSAYLALYPALFGWLINRFAPQAGKWRYWVVIPCGWLLTEWLRGWVFTGFPWLWLGYSQIDSPFASLAPIGGVALITLAIMFVASSVAHILVTRQKQFILVPIAVLVIAISLKPVNWVSPQPNSDTTVALIQGNIDQKLKWLPSQRFPTLNKYVDLTLKNLDADIIIWPEAAIPAFEYELTDFLAGLDRAARAHHTAIITGILNKVSRNKYYNSILTIGENGQARYQHNVSRRYHKHHLLPFGEFVPFEKWLRPLAPLFNLPMSSFSPGDYIQPNIEANHRHLVAALCYEIIFNEQIRDNITSDTDFILTLSNDAWFGHSIGPVQHMEIARMRALEFGKPVIRATNNGITAITDFKGNITYTVPSFETAVLKATIHSTQGKTPYCIWGSWPLYAYVFIALISTLLINRRRHSLNKLSR